ncbi:hypothetical protein J2W49_004889 [Hydrogenophaga palleronii]|uniref:Uncharacterized protein n=1 Tax=Hydrogenophaga palleronii TaxID=65655 RepID=A0ABU1WVE8_9BURK|nr:hypothetical protein [Hydrogenophaga palleronii]MDR7152911.1 hypothetical protein [Hydrogenophaga palleronii]
MSIETFLIEWAAREVVKVFERSKAAGIAFVITVIAMSIGLGVFAFNFGKGLAEREKVARLASAPIQSERDLAEALRAISDYSERKAQEARDTAAEAQRAQLVLEESKKQAEHFSSIAATNKSAVEAIFREQDARAEQSFWKVQWFGFLVGILSTFATMGMIWVGRKARALWKAGHPTDPGIPG